MMNESLHTQDHTQDESDVIKYAHDLMNNFYSRYNDGEGQTRDELLDGLFIMQVRFCEDNLPPVDFNRFLSDVENMARRRRCLGEFRNAHAQKRWEDLRIKREAEIRGGIGAKTRFTGQPIELDCGEWTADDNGIRREKPNIKSVGEFDEACGTPVTITELLKNTDTGAERVRLAYKLHGHWESRTFDADVLMDSHKVVSALSHYGISITSNSAKFAVEYFRTLKERNKDVIPVHDSVSHLGWCDDKCKRGFAPYGNFDDDEIDAENGETGERLAFDGESRFTGVYRAVHEEGSYTVWDSMMRILRKNKVFRLIMAASFAAPLVQYMSWQPFMVHIHGKSGLGKTVAVRAALSVWGDPSDGKLLHTLNSTKNYMSAVAAFMYSLPVAFDELQTIKAKDGYRDIIMQLCSGIERGKMFDGTRAQEQKTWRTSFITTGEEPITGDNSGGGELNRVISIDVNGEEPIPEGIGGDIVNVVCNNYGFAGRMFVYALEHSTSKGELLKLYDEYYAGLIDGKAADKQAAAMSALLIADRLARKYVFVGGDEAPLTVSDVIEYTTSRDEMNPAKRALQFVADLVTSNEARFTSVDQNGEYWGNIRKGKDGLPTGVVDWVPSILRRELKKEGYNFDAVKREWAKCEVLKKGSKDSYQFSAKENGRVVKVTRLDLSGINGEVTSVTSR